ncbi:SPOR domain-containing protein [Devosia sp. MC1541]|uniref:SPOR domain-containing protein n=1 Tax=Devosia sp. MC1541 TaxID=2725264 RepID=UPI00145EABAB|nr:SPOR domain-containing protein [Devosia sp. MC1541]
MAGQSDAPDDLIAELARLMAGEARPENAPSEPEQPRVRIPGDDSPQMSPVPRFDFTAQPPSERVVPPAPPVAPRPVTQPVGAPPASQPQVRVPSPAPVPPQAPTPSLDFALRPGVTAAPTQPLTQPPQPPVEPFAFDFDLRSAQRPSAPTSPVPSAPAVASPQPSLDQGMASREQAPQFVPQQPVSPQRPVEPTPVRREPMQAQVVSTAPVVVEDEPEPINLDQDSLADLIASELAKDQLQSEDNTGGNFEFEVEPDSVAPQSDDYFSQVATHTRGVEQPSVYAAADFSDSVRAASSPFDEPSFGIAPEPASATPHQRRQEPGFGTDPLAEIERLVGPAVRMSVQQDPAPEPIEQAEPKSAPAPLRSLATPTLPPETEQAPRGPRRRASSADTSSVDDAILAAAAASGARVEWVDHTAGSDADDGGEYSEPRRRRSFGVNKAVLGPLLAILLLGAGGGALYYMLGSGGSSGPAPTIVADTAPIKEEPEPSTEAPAQSVIFNEMAGGNNGANEQIVPRDQADPETISEATQNSGIGNVINSIDQGTTNPDGLVNRRVRTVTVRPDGTIVSGDSGLAGTSMLPVDRPNVPELPGNTAAANTTAPSETVPAAAAPPVVETPANPAVPPVQPGSVVPVVNASGAAVAGRTVAIPSVKPSDFASTAAAAISAAAAAPAPQDLAAPAAAAPVAAVPASAPASGGAYVQLSSQRTEAAARESAQAIATRFGVLFGGANLEIQQVNLGERGIYYRVLVPAASREAAVNVCTNVRAAGGDCLLL